MGYTKNSPRTKSTFPDLFHPESESFDQFFSEPSACLKMALEGAECTTRDVP